MPRTAFRWINLVFALMFLASGALQYNDPDPLRWVLIYGGAAAACLISSPPALKHGLPLLVGSVSLLWALFLLPRMLPDFRFGDLFLAMKAETPAIEWGREALGLLIIAAWMIVLLMRRRDRQSPAPTKQRAL